MFLNLLLLLKNEDRTGEKRLKNDNVMSDWLYERLVFTRQNDSKKLPKIKQKSQLFHTLIAQVNYFKCIQRKKRINNW